MYTVICAYIFCTNKILWTCANLRLVEFELQPKDKQTDSMCTGP